MKDQDNNINEIAFSAVIICKHIAIEDKPVCFAVKTSPDFPEDSGWQILCDDHHTESDAQLWTIKELLEYDPNLTPFILLPVGTRLSKSQSGYWKVLVD